MEFLILYICDRGVHSSTRLFPGFDFRFGVFSFSGMLGFGPWIGFLSPVLVMIGLLGLASAVLSPHRQSQV